jgi:hypothetical protein
MSKGRNRTVYQRDNKWVNKRMMLTEPGGCTTRRLKPLRPRLACLADRAAEN